MLPESKPYALSLEDFKAGKEQYYKFERGEISLEEYQKEIAYFALLCGFNEIVYSPLPTSPREILDYNELKPLQQQKVDDKFWKSPDIAKFIKTKAYSLIKTSHSA